MVHVFILCNTKRPNPANQSANFCHKCVRLWWRLFPPHARIWGKLRRLIPLLRFFILFFFFFGGGVEAEISLRGAHQFQFFLARSQSTVAQRTNTTVDEGALTCCALSSFSLLGSHAVPRQHSQRLYLARFLGSPIPITQCWSCVSVGY